MLITFKSRAHADVTMFGDVALELIRLMGRRDTVPSAMYPEDIPDALGKLRSGLVLQEAAESVVVTNDVDEDEEEQIGIQTRAIPLIELMVAAKKEQVPVMWEEGARFPSG